MSKLWAERGRLMQEAIDQAQEAGELRNLALQWVQQMPESEIRDCFRAYARLKAQHASIDTHHSYLDILVGSYANTKQTPSPR